MSDKELLEMAAKAAGISPDKSFNGGFDELGSVVLDWRRGDIWNPLERDSDAFRLAVILRLELQHYQAEDTDFVSAGPESLLGPLSIESHDQDAFKATRRAIVKAAAEMA